MRRNIAEADGGEAHKAVWVAEVLLRALFEELSSCWGLEQHGSSRSDGDKWSISSMKSTQPVLAADISSFALFWHMNCVAL